MERLDGEVHRPPRAGEPDGPDLCFAAQQKDPFGLTIENSVKIRKGD